ncbi:MAG: hypothetical protein AAGN66_27995 [Acidobacteriota bacterium]
MAITHHNEDLLPNLESTPEQLATTTGCWAFGPIKICWTLRGGELRVCVYLLEIEIGCATLSPENTELCIGAAVPPFYPLAKAQICVYANFDKCTLGAKGEVCARPPGGSWNCARFDEIILRWC